MLKYQILKIIVKKKIDQARKKVKEFIDVIKNNKIEEWFKKEKTKN